MARRIEIEADDVGRLALEIGIVGSHVALQAMGPQTGLAPNAMDQVLADAELLGELAAGPMGGAVAGLALGGGEDLGAHFGRQLGGRLAGTMRFEAVETVVEEAPSPTGLVLLRRSGLILLRP